MPENQTTQAETRKSSNGDGGSGKQQGRSVTTQESGGRTNRALTRQGSRALTAAQQNPFGMMRQLSREMDRLMDSFFERGFGSLWRESGGAQEDDWQGRTLWSPQIDVQQRNDSVIVRADLPGIGKENVQVEVEGDALIISGQRREEREEGGDDQGYRLLERSYGSFYRSVPLPQGVDPDQIEAAMRDGVLTVTLPLAENARPRRIDIQS
jgi:HSP20 family protein